MPEVKELPAKSKLFKDIFGVTLIFFMICFVIAFPSLFYLKMRC